MREILLVSHGTMAEGVYKAASMIFGKLNNVRYLCLEDGMGIELYKEKVNELIEEVKDADEILVLADLMGGSPYNSILTILNEKELLGKSKVLSGLNLPMLLTVLFIKDELSQVEVKSIINSAREAIDIFKIEENVDEEL